MGFPNDELGWKNSIKILEKILLKYIDNKIFLCYKEYIQSEMLWVIKHYLSNDALWALMTNCLAESTIWRPKKRQQFVKDAFF